MTDATSEGGVTRDVGYRSQGITVEIHEHEGDVSLSLDGIPIDVALIDGKYYSQTAHMFRSFDSVEDIVDELIRNNGRTWQLHPLGEHGGHAHGQGEHGGHAHGEGEHGGHAHGEGGGA